MTVNLKLLGCERDPLVPGKHDYLYWCEGIDIAAMDVIRDEDYIEDGTYEVPDTFFEDHSQAEELAEQEW